MSKESDFEIIKETWKAEAVLSRIRFAIENLAPQLREQQIIDCANTIKESFSVLEKLLGDEIQIRCTCGDGKRSGINTFCPIHGTEDATEYYKKPKAKIIQP